MNSDRLLLMPIGYVAVVLFVTNLIGYIAVTHLERCGERRNTHNIDVICSYLCFGISFVFVTVPTIAARGAQPINRMSAFLVFLWSTLYLIALYFSVFDTLSALNETEWIQWVAVSFLYLLPHAIGLTLFCRKRTCLPIQGFLLSVVGLLMLSLSVYRTWQHMHHLVDAERTLSPSTDSWWGNCVFWMGIFLLNVQATTTFPDQVAVLRESPHSRLLSRLLMLIVSFVFGPGLLLFSHPHIQNFLHSKVYSSLLGIQQPPVNISWASFPDPTLLRFIRLEHELQAVHGSFSEPIADVRSQVQTIETRESVGCSFTEELPNSLFHPEVTTAENHDCLDAEPYEGFERIEIPDVPKVSPVLHQPMIASTSVFASEMKIESEQPDVIRTEKPPTSLKMFLSKFKLKITSEVLSGHWN
jgi:hypothetical protein